MKLSNYTYFSKAANVEYLSASQLKEAISCEARALANLTGEFSENVSKSLLIGSYVDAYFAGELPEFTEKHPEIFNSRTGELKSDFVKADNLIRRAERDEVFMDALDGRKQEIMTGNLFGHKFKIKMDAYHPGERIVDLKVMRDMKRIYKNGEWRSFVDAWGYDIQGYIYQQVVKDQTGEELPFYLAVITKEEHPDLELIHIPQWKLNSAAALVEHYADRFAAIKEGKLEPNRCGNCDYCRDTKKLTGSIEYEELINADL